jgi:hypothetical protein
MKKGEDFISEYDIHEDENISILPSELTIAIMEFKHGKSTGDDGILNECLRLVLKDLVMPVTKLLAFNAILGKRKYHLHGSGVPSFYCQNKVLTMIQTTSDPSPSFPNFTNCTQKIPKKTH